MFDIGWSELLLIGIVALIAIGPKELPGALRTLGQWMGKLRRMASEFQGQFHEAMREAEMADLKKQVDEMTSAGAELRQLRSGRRRPQGIRDHAAADRERDRRPAPLRDGGDGRSRDRPTTASAPAPSGAEAADRCAEHRTPMPPRRPAAPSDRRRPAARPSRPDSDAGGKPA